MILLSCPYNFAIPGDTVYGEHHGSMPSKLPKWHTYLHAVLLSPTIAPHG